MTRRVGGLGGGTIAAILLLSVSTTAFAATGGNDFYSVTVETSPGGFGIGVYKATTGPGHPITGALGVQSALFSVIPGTSYTTIRSYTTGADYTPRNNLTLLAPALTLDGFVLPGEEAVPLGDPASPAGFRTTWRPGTVAAAPDTLTIAQEVSVVGSTYSSSAAAIRTSITNDGASSVSLGIRYLWDIHIGGGDDGPTFQAINPDGAVLGNEADAASPTFERFESVDNNDPASCSGTGNTPVPFYAVSGSVTGPAPLAPTSPTRLAYVSWANVSGLVALGRPVIPAVNAFDYTPTGLDAATCVVSADESGVAYWWGDTPENALIVAPGATVTVTAYLYAYLPEATPPFTEGPSGDPTCEDGEDNDGDGLVDLADPDCVNLPPDCSTVTTSPGLVWPPNHKHRRVMVGGVDDPDGDPVTISITSIRQDEAVNEPGSGNTCPDGSTAGDGAATLRSERSGRGDGRVYHLDFTADDGRGGTCTGSVAVCVPHDRGRKNQCVDQGPLFDSTGTCSGKGKGKGRGKGHGNGHD
jgi:hypothetical protein